MRGMQYCSCCLWLLQSHSFKQRDFGTSAVWQQVPATCQTSMVIFFWCQEQSSDEYVSVMRRSHKYSFSSCWYLGSSEGWLKQMCTELGCSWVPRCSSAACHCLHSRTAGELEFILLSFQGPHQNYFFWGSSCTDTTWVELCSAQRVCQVAEQGSIPSEQLLWPSAWHLYAYPAGRAEWYWYWMCAEFIVYLLHTRVWYLPSVCGNWYQEWPAVLCHHWAAFGQIQPDVQGF